MRPQRSHSLDRAGAGLRVAHVDLLGGDVSGAPRAASTTSAAACALSRKRKVTSAPSAREQLDDRTADAAATAGDHYDFAGYPRIELIIDSSSPRYAETAVDHQRVPGDHRASGRQSR